MNKCKRAIDDKRPPDDNHPDVPEEWPDVPEEWPEVADEDVWEWQESDSKAPVTTRF
jgi:hypothetical protein